MNTADGSHSYLFHQKEKHIGQFPELNSSYSLSLVNWKKKSHMEILYLWNWFTTLSLATIVVYCLDAWHWSSTFSDHRLNLSGYDIVIIDWMRIGAFTLDSRTSLLTESLSGQLKVPREGTIERMLQSSGSCVIKDIKSGIWIAGKKIFLFMIFRNLSTAGKNVTWLILFPDLQLVRCPVCDLSTCDGKTR